jgi:hypothetical protein
VPGRKLIQARQGDGMECDQRSDQGQRGSRWRLWLCQATARGICVLPTHRSRARASRRRLFFVSSDRDEAALRPNNASAPAGAEADARWTGFCPSSCRSSFGAGLPRAATSCQKGAHTLLLFRLPSSTPPPSFPFPSFRLSHILSLSPSRSSPLAPCRSYPLHLFSSSYPPLPLLFPGSLPIFSPSALSPFLFSSVARAAV